MPDLNGLIGAGEKLTAGQNLPGDWSEWAVSGVKAFPGALGFGLQVWVAVITVPGPL